MTCSPSFSPLTTGKTKCARLPSPKRSNHGIRFLARSYSVDRNDHFAENRCISPDDKEHPMADFIRVKLQGIP
jgi:hypothetical protein